MLKDIIIGFPSKNVFSSVNSPTENNPTASHLDLSMSMEDKPNIRVRTTGCVNDIRSMILDDQRVIIAAPFVSGTKIIIIRLNHLETVDNRYYEFQMPDSIFDRKMCPLRAILSYLILNAFRILPNKERKKVLSMLMGKLKRLPIIYRFGKYRFTIHRDFNITIQTKTGFYHGHYSGLNSVIRLSLDGKANVDYNEKHSATQAS